MLVLNINIQYTLHLGSEVIEADISDLEKHIPKLQKQLYKIEKNQADQELETREIKELIQQQQTQQQNGFSNCTTLTGPANIMLVDDEPDILLTYKTHIQDLDSTDYNVDSFTNPREALMHFEQADPNNYNLVLMDIRMPNLNGIQLYYRLKAINPKIKILFVSALDAAQEMISILPGIGFDDVIRKPANIEQFLFKVKKALE
jgi:CheY-like chemotaxis protein